MQLFANNATSALASGVNDTDNTLVLASGEGARFPSPTGGDYFLVTLTQGVGLETSWEIVKCTARTTDTLTVSRAQEGTVAAAFSAGDKIELRVTAATCRVFVSATPWLIKTTNYNAVAGDAIQANTTSAAFTVTLPAAPAANDSVQIADYTGTFGINNLTVGRNALNIMGLAEDLVISTNNVSITLQYIDATEGWKIV